MERLRNLGDVMRSYWENLTDRERLFLGGLGAFVAAIVVLLPVYLLTSSINELEEENQEINRTLQAISRSRGLIAQQQAERAAAEQRYSRRAPSLGSFLEAKAGELEGLSITDATHEPERELGDFRVRTTRARFQGTGLRNAILFLAAVKNSRYPVAIERLHIDHVQAGDRYNFQVGVLAFNRPDSEQDAGTAAPSRPGRTRRAGPPPPRP